MPNETLSSDTIPRRPAADHSCVILITCEEYLWDQQSIDYEILFQNLTQETLKAINCSLYPEISILLTNNNAIEKLNATYRNKNQPTNVLSFPSFEADELANLQSNNNNNLITDDENVPIGDLIFAFEQISQESNEEKKTFKNHVMHLFVHGLLHLFGYDHETEEEGQEMENLEIKILKRFDIKNPYEDQ